jgi:hypothetical protein
MSDEASANKKRVADEERDEALDRRRRKLRKEKKQRFYGPGDGGEELDELPEPDDDSDHTYSHNEWDTDSSTDSQSSVTSSASSASSSLDSSDGSDSEDVGSVTTTTTTTVTTKKTTKVADESSTSGTSEDEQPSQLDVCESRYRLLYNQKYGGLTEIQKHVYESIVADSEWGPVTPQTFAQLSDDQHYDVLDHYARAWLSQALPFQATENRVKHVIDALKF